MQNGVVLKIAAHLKQSFPRITFTAYNHTIEIGALGEKGVVFFSNKWFPAGFTFSKHSTYIDLKNPNSMDELIDFVKRVINDK